MNLNPNKMVKTVDNFKRAVQKRNITSWDGHKCSTCDYQTQFHFTNGNVYYDTGCYCNGEPSIFPRIWEDVVTRYNAINDPEKKKAVDLFFGFTDNKA